MKKTITFDDNAIGIGHIILIISVILILILTVTFRFLETPVTCEPEYKNFLKGELRGYTRNNTYWDVYLGNQSFLFNRFDSEYMRFLIGENITVVCCLCCNNVFEADHYDMVEAFIS